MIIGENKQKLAQTIANHFGGNEKMYQDILKAEDICGNTENMRGTAEEVYGKIGGILEVEFEKLKKQDKKEITLLEFAEFVNKRLFFPKITKEIETDFHGNPLYGIPSVILNGDYGISFEDKITFIDNFINAIKDLNSIEIKEKNIFGYNVYYHCYFFFIHTVPKVRGSYIEELLFNFMENNPLIKEAIDEYMKDDDTGDIIDGYKTALEGDGGVIKNFYESTQKLLEDIERQKKELDEADFLIDM